MFKIKSTVQSLQFFSRFTHTFQNENLTQNYPLTEPLVNGVTYPYYQIRAISPEHFGVVIEYLRNNHFQNDPIIRSFSISGFHPNVEKLIREKLHNSISVMAVSACPEQNVLGVAIGSPFSTIESDLISKLAKEVTDVSLQKYLEYLAHFKYLHELSSNLVGSSKVWELSMLSTDRMTRGHGIGRMLAKQIFVHGKERGFQYARIDCTNSLNTIISKRLQMRLMWVVEFKDFSNYYQDAMRGILCPHTGLSVYVEDLRSRKMSAFEKEVHEFNEKCKSQLIQYH